MKVELAEEADAQVDKIERWWRQYRPSARDLFTHELDRALVMLGETPAIGTSTRQARER
ncbi:MAG: hypothetical protein ACREJ3_20125 [Polyangiaceae bacterium]